GERALAGTFNVDAVLVRDLQDGKAERRLHVAPPAVALDEGHLGHQWRFRAAESSPNFVRRGKVSAPLLGIEWNIYSPLGARSSARMPAPRTAASSAAAPWASVAASLRRTMPSTVRPAASAASSMAPASACSTAITACVTGRA